MFFKKCVQGGTLLIIIARMIILLWFQVVGLDDLLTECSMQSSPDHLLSDLSIFQIDRESLLFKDVATDIEDLDMLEDISDKIKNSTESKLDKIQASPKSKTQDFPVHNWYAFEDFESYRAPVAQSIPHAVPSPKITSLQQFPAPKGPPPPTPPSLPLLTCNYASSQACF
eukprot:TRINITY_DN5240_c0_g2_i3.p2 TRINITY_DN5240_c0_g2~~TRINITY_DN5240_c0_g2_i3.p2  ORF type:complete len:170 (+),score=9.50 TRINITY_DN5240_c0_g2_i3:4-513(+)